MAINPGPQRITSRPISQASRGMRPALPHVSTWRTYGGGKPPKGHENRLKVAKTDYNDLDPQKPQKHI